MQAIQHILLPLVKFFSQKLRGFQMKVTRRIGEDLRYRCLQAIGFTASIFLTINQHIVISFIFCYYIKMKDCIKTNNRTFQLNLK